MNKQRSWKLHGSDLICPICGSGGKIKDSGIIYGKSYGLVWACKNFPVCDVFVGVHKGTTTPLGTLADRRTREMRKQCHREFDVIWQTGRMTRKDAYIKAASEMKVGDFHIGELGYDDCVKFIEVLKRTDGFKKKFKGGA